MRLAVLERLAIAAVFLFSVSFAAYVGYNVGRAHEKFDAEWEHIVNAPDASVPE